MPGTPGPPRRPRRKMALVLSVAAAVAVLISAGGAYVFLHKTALARASNTGKKTNGSTGTKSTVTAAKPEHLVSATPSNGASGVNGAGQIQVVFSQPLDPTSPMPTISPAIKGSWQVSGDTAVFVPDRGFTERTRVTIRIPGGKAGIISKDGGTLAVSATIRYRVGSYSPVRLEQLLARLGYLPLSWAPSTGSPVPLSDARAELNAAYAPPQGAYTWQSGYPAALTSLWAPDRPSEILKGAVMAFEADHGLTLDGIIGPQVWHAMFAAVAANQVNQHGYTYALASQKLPETLTVWHDGKVIFQNAANTGIPVAPTLVGTNPVYLRYQHQIMRGTNPDGTKYADPVSWVAYFYRGEAVHYFPRASYGFPQSLGCVELPYAPAKQIWPYLTYGTLVTVTAA